MYAIRSYYVLLWVSVAYLDRGAQFKQEAKFLRSYMNQIVYPDEKGAATTKALTDALRVQINDLHEAIAKAGVETGKVKAELAKRTDELNDALDKIEKRTNVAVNRLGDEIRNMSEMSDAISFKSNQASEILRNNAQEAEDYVQHALVV